MKFLIILLFPFFTYSQISDFEKHQFCSCGICIVAGTSIYKITHDCKKSCGGAFKISFGIGLAKELKDKVFGKTDLLADFKGSLTGLFFLRVGIDMHEKKKHKDFWYD